MGEGYGGRGRRGDGHTRLPCLGLSPEALVEGQSGEGEQKGEQGGGR